MDKICLVALVIFLSACAPQQVEIRKQAQWETYYKSLQKQQELPQQKHFEIQLTEDGKVKGIAIYAIEQRPKIEQPREQYHPAWEAGGRIIQTAIPVVGAVWGMKVMGDNMVNLAHAVQAPTTNNTTTTNNSTTIRGDTYTDSSNGDHLADSGNTQRDILSDSYNGDHWADSGNTATSTDNSNQGNPITTDNSNQGNPITTDNSNQGNPIDNSIYNPIVEAVTP